MFPEAGGSSSFARHAFNEFVSFFAGWALSLDYILTIAISAFFVPHYLGAFFPALTHNSPGDMIGGIVVIIALAALNIRGIGESAKLNFILAALDLATQVIIIVVGIVPGAGPVAARQPGAPRDRADVQPPDLRAVAGDARVHRDRDGLEHGRGGARSGARRATRRQPDPDRGDRGVRRDHGRRAQRAAGDRPRQRTRSHSSGGKYQNDPVLGIIDNLGLPTAIPHILRYYVGILAATILFIATNAGLIGISRSVVVTRRASPAAADLRAAASRHRTPWFTIVAVLGVRRHAADPGTDRVPRQPVLVRRDAVVHDRPRLDHRAAV